MHIFKVKKTAVYSFYKLVEETGSVNPCLHKIWSKFKSYLKKVKACSFETLEKEILPALNSISTTDIKNWFSHSEDSC